MAEDTLAMDAFEDATLLSVVQQAQQALGCDDAGLVQLRGGLSMPAAHTSEIAGALDRAQCDSGEGPSLDAIRQLQAMSVPAVDELTWWPAFRRTALAGGVQSCLAVPLTVGSEVVGALAFYCRRVNALAGCEEAALQIAHRTGADMTRQP